MAAGLMRQSAGDSIKVHSAGTRPGSEVNALSAESLLEVGVDIRNEKPTPIDPQLLEQVDVVVTLGREARPPQVEGPRYEIWDTDEPSERGIEGIERMRLVRDDIKRRVDDLRDRLTD
jgi:arsenate-mycothiol transferase